MWKIIVTLRGGTVVALGDVRSGKPGWADCDPAGIAKIEFNFLGRDGEGKDVPYTLIMSGMLEYNFFVEAMKPVGSNKGIVVKGLWFLGKKPDGQNITGFALKESIMAVNALVGKEYHGTPTVGWKTGIIEGEPICRVFRSL